MGYTVWHFVVDEVKGDLKRVPAVRWSALWNGEIPMPEWAGPEVRAIELALEVHRRRVQRLLRVLAHRMIVRSDGLHDVDRELKRTTEVVWAAQERTATGKHHPPFRPDCLEEHTPVSCQVVHPGSVAGCCSHCSTSE